MRIGGSGAPLTTWWDSPRVAGALTPPTTLRDGRRHSGTQSNYFFEVYSVSLRFSENWSGEVGEEAELGEVGEVVEVGHISQVFFRYHHSPESHKSSPL